jgi:two-component system sensor histidine kinase RegB
MTIRSKTATIPDHPNRINFGWLLRLRWAMSAGQLVAMGGVQLGLRLDLPLAPLLSIVAVEVALNVVGIILQRRYEPQEWWLVSLMASDIILFTGLLLFTGGPANPFSFLYLVQIALAAITVRAAWSWALTGLALLGSAALFLFDDPLPSGITHAAYMAFHLRGMWVAFGVAAGFIVYFLFRVRKALEKRDTELAESRQATARQARLASLITLAAGAAHELSTPLATIAVAVKELERNHVDSKDPDLLSDVRLIREQVDRCRDILKQMASNAGQTIGENWEPLAAPDLVDAALSGLSQNIQVRSDIAPTIGDLRLRLPQNALAQALRGLVKNAQEASPTGRQVCVRVEATADAVLFAIHDEGTGIAEADLDRLGEPFFTTKPTGGGMGLGVFLARAVAERLGGGLTFESQLGRGTIARLTVPLSLATRGESRS